MQWFAKSYKKQILFWNVLTFSDLVHIFKKPTPTLCLLFFLLAHVSKADETFLLDGTRAGPVVWSPPLCGLDVNYSIHLKRHSTLSLFGQK